MGSINEVLLFDLPTKDPVNGDGVGDHYRHADQGDGEHDGLGMQRRARIVSGQGMFRMWLGWQHVREQTRAKQGHY